jgi:hypothetical protein
MTGGERGGPAAPLQRLKALLERRPSRRAGEACELCSQDIRDAHSHVVHVESRRLLCACRACYLLFTHEGPARGKYRGVPDRYRSAAGFRLTDAQWDALQIPVGIAFFFFNSSMQRMVAFYPSPAGAAESLLPLGAWDDAMTANPLVASLTPDVEALLVQHRRGLSETYLVPIDACYELVGRIRRHWRGFDGGEEAWAEIDAFFAAVRGRGEPVAAEADR